MGPPALQDGRGRGGVTEGRGGRGRTMEREAEKERREG